MKSSTTPRFRIAVLFLLLPGFLLGEPVLLIGNKSDDTLTFVDAETLEILGETTTGQGPHEVAASPDGKWAYVANYEGPGDSLSWFLDTFSGTLRRGC